MNIYIVTLFPDELRSAFSRSIFNRAEFNNVFSLTFINIRDFSIGRYKKVDDYPFGYKQGMLLRADVLYRAITSIDNYDSYRMLYMCPKGDSYCQPMATKLSREPGLILISGYYEGVDERIFDRLPIERISVGPYVLSSGDLPALIVTESILRLLDGVIGKKKSVDMDSYLTGLLEHPHYTHPRQFDGLGVPDVLLSGHHKHIHDWQVYNSLKETLYNQPMLLQNYDASDNDQHYLMTILKEKIND